MRLIATFPVWFLAVYLSAAISDRFNMSRIGTVGVAMVFTILAAAGHDTIKAIWESTP